MPMVLIGTLAAPLTSCVFVASVGVICIEMILAARSMYAWAFERCVLMSL
jgi:hypothetical protein